MSDVLVREAAPEDVETVLDLWHEMMHYHARLDKRFQPTPDARDRFRTTLLQWMALDTQRVLVAVVDGQIVGYTIGRLVENPPFMEWRFLGHVSDICVAPEWRRQGIGRKLFATLREWFRQQGMTVVQLHVAAANPVSFTFWREMGFKDHMHRLWLEM